MTDPIDTSPERVHETAKSEHVTLPRAVLEQMVGALDYMTQMILTNITDAPLSTEQAIDEWNNWQAALTAGRAVLEKGECTCAAKDMPFGRCCKAPASEPAIKDGWKLVPIEATPEMIHAGSCHHYTSSRSQDRADAESAWDSMVAAAPEAS